ncbi:hypothetical protein D3C75_623010 [compost metagenome]
MKYLLIVDEKSSMYKQVQYMSDWTWNQSSIDFVSVTKYYLMPTLQPIMMRKNRENQIVIPFDFNLLIDSVFK